MPGSASLKLADASLDRSLVTSSVRAYVQSRGGSDDDAGLAADVLDSLVAWILANAYPSGRGPLVITMRSEEHELHLEVHDTGQPLRSFGGPHTPPPPELADVATRVRDLHLENLGKSGKTLACWIPWQGSVPSAEIGPAQADFDAEDIVFRLARPEDALGVGALMHAQYGLRYVHSEFYDPDRLREWWASGDVLSGVALHGDTVVAHTAFFRSGGSESLEAGAAVVHPAYRSKGLGLRVNLVLGEELQNREIPAMMSYLATQHTHSQSLAERSGFVVTGLLLGLHAPGLYGDHQRLALVTAYLVLRPQSRPVALPTRYATELAAVYDSLGLPIVDQDLPGALATLPDGSGVKARALAPAAPVIVSISRWTPDDRALLLDVLRDAVRSGATMCLTDINLCALTTAEQDDIIDLLRTYDHFLGALMPFGAHGHDFLRMQAILTDDLELDSISLSTDAARRVREVVFNDHDQLAERLKSLE